MFPWVPHPMVPYTCSFHISWFCLCRLHILVVLLSRPHIWQLVLMGFTSSDPTYFIYFYVGVWHCDYLFSFSIHNMTAHSWPNSPLSQASLHISFISSIFIFYSFSGCACSIWHSSLHIRYQKISLHMCCSSCP